MNLVWETKERTIVPKEVGEHSLQVLVVGEAVQGLLQSDGRVLEAGEETVQTRLHQEGHQKLRQHFEHDEPIEAAHRMLRTKHNHLLLFSLSFTVPGKHLGHLSLVDSS